MHYHIIGLLSDSDECSAFRQVLQLLSAYIGTGRAKTPEDIHNGLANRATIWNHHRFPERTYSTSPTCFSKQHCLLPQNNHLEWLFKHTLPLLCNAQPHRGTSVKTQNDLDNKHPTNKQNCYTVYNAMTCTDMAACDDMP